MRDRIFGTHRRRPAGCLKLTESIGRRGPFPFESGPETESPRGCRTRGEGMEAISVLKKDHRMVEELFKKFEQAGDRAFKTKRRLVDEIITELSVHAAIEEQVFYPATREAREENEEMVLEALEEHHLVKLALSELEKMDPADERFTAKVTVLIENVRHHVKEEEGQMFPKVRKAMKPDDLARLGEELEEAKESAPTRPHPAAPDQPPGNVVAGSMATVMDAGKDAVRGVKEEIRRRRG